MISLDKILVNELKYGEINSTIHELAKAKLYADFSTSIYLINNHLQSINGSNYVGSIVKIGHLIQLSLIKCQFTIQELDGDEKEKVLPLTELIISRVYADVLLELSGEKKNCFIENMQQLWDESAYFFNLKDYSFKRLRQLTDMPCQSSADDIAISSCQNGKNCGLIWNENGKDSFENFLELICDLDIADKTDFKKLFDYPDKHLNLVLNTAKPDFVLQFLCCLKESKLISYYNSRGFYQVFRHHVKNFDAVFLKNRTPKRRVDAVKNHVSWVSRKARIDGLLKQLL